MAGVTVKIRSLYPSLPNTERRVADYVLQNIKAVPFKTVYDLAESAGTSVASVSRFVRTVGYNSFKDFKVELAQDTPPALAEIYGEISPGDSEEDIVKKIFRGNIQSIEDTLKLLNVQDIIGASHALSRAGRILFFGIGGSGTVARDAALRFSLIDVQAEAYTEPVHILTAAKRLKKGDVGVGISHSGRTVMTVNGLKLAHGNGAITIGITNYLKTPLSSNADYIFCTAFSENKVKVAALSPLTAQICIIDALYLLVAYNRKNIWNIEDLNRITEHLLRMKE